MILAYTVAFLYFAVVSIYLAGGPRRLAACFTSLWRTAPGASANAPSRAPFPEDGVSAKSVFRPGQLTAMALIDAEGEALFGRKVRVVPRAALRDFLFAKNGSDQMDLGQLAVDILVTESAGKPLLAIQLGDAPKTGGNGYHGHRALAAAGIPVAYLGSAPSDEQVRLTIVSMRDAGVLS